ncbi:MAG: beta-aspartyl-peptidase [Eubacterium sp.]|nr:beta-aspartyl-peptidase [Eubacterium sp.]
MLLIKNIHVCAPEDLGIKDVLICGRQIEAVAESIDISPDLCDTIDGEGYFLTPGIIDPHVHITGGGGEGSFHTQVPPVTLGHLIQGGVTTVLGLLGTDGITRSVENLVAKAKALNEEGITAYACTGAYGYPSPSLTGDIKKDIAFVSEIIGVKLALSDHRAPNVTKAELIRLASDARVAGMLSGKSGALTLHMGDAASGLSLVFDILDSTPIPIKLFHPTHVNRNPRLLTEAFEFARRGGFIDLTCGIEALGSPVAAILQAKAAGIPLDKITVSSDGMGSWSNYDDAGNLTAIGYSPVDSVYKALVALVQDCGLSLSEALPFVTENTARALELFPKKGCIRPGADADVLILDDTLALDTVIAGGQVMMLSGKLLKRGTYA